MSKKETIISFVKTHGFITLDEARTLGISPTMMGKYVNQGVLLKPERGIYTNNLEWLTDPLKKYLPVCTLIEDSIICGISALSYYNLTDEEERKTWIALPHKTRTHSRQYKVIRPSGEQYSLGIKIIKIGKRLIRIYDREKTIVDAFKYLPEEVALKALKSYLRLKECNLEKLLKYSKKLKKPLNDIVKIILAK